MAGAKIAPDIPGEPFVFKPPRTPFSAERTAAIQAQSLALADGRSLEYFIDGDDTKPAVLLIHGQWQTGSFWLNSQRDDVFLIMPTRPNYGGSSAHAGYSYETFADDVRQLADHLGIQRFHVMGASSGGPCAIAIKAILRERVGSCHVISGDTENATLKGGGSQAELSCCAPGKCCGDCLPCCLSCCMLPALRALLDPDKMWRKIEKGDAKGLGITTKECAAHQQAGKARLAHSMQSMRVGMRDCQGGLADYRAEAKPWTFSVPADLAPVAMWHGDADSTVPLAAMLHNHGKLPHATVHKVEGMGHEMGGFMIDERLDELAMAPLGTEPMLRGE